jgi:hypothetical protein
MREIFFMRINPDDLPENLASCVYHTRDRTAIGPTR